MTSRSSSAGQVGAGAVDAEVDEGLRQCAALHLGRVAGVVDAIVTLKRSWSSTDVKKSVGVIE